jgi:hypothetical protein
VDDLYRSDADKANLVGLLSDGWSDAVAPMVVTVASDKDKARIVEQRANRYAELVKAAEAEAEGGDDVEIPSYSIKDGEGRSKKYSLGAKAFLEQYRYLYMRPVVGEDDKPTGDFEPIEPEYMGVMGFRRKHVWPLVNAYRAKLDKEPLLEIPVQVAEFENQLDRIQLNLDENGLKTQGNRPLDHVDQLAISRDLVQLHGLGESALIKALKCSRGMGQKLYPICRLDGLYKTLKIIPSLLTREWDFKKLRANELRELITKAEAFVTKKETDAFADTVKGYFTAPRQGNDSKIMEKKKIANLAESCPIEVARFAFKAVIKDNPTALEEFMPHVEAINAAVTDILAGKMLISLDEANALVDEAVAPLKERITELEAATAKTRKATTGKRK